MKITQTPLPDVLVIEPTVFTDARGFFFEHWNAQRCNSENGLPRQLVQSNISYSKQGVLRGLHYQYPHPQGKLIHVLEGEIYDVAVDIRRGSPYFGRWTAAFLNAQNKRQLWIPEGFAHGFVVVSASALVQYLCTSPYQRECDASIRWNDAELAIDWCISSPELSEKDAKAPFLNEIELDKLPIYSQ